MLRGHLSQPSQPSSPGIYLEVTFHVGVALHAPRCQFRSLWTLTRRLQHNINSPLSEVLFTAPTMQSKSTQITFPECSRSVCKQRLPTFSNIKLAKSSHSRYEKMFRSQEERFVCIEKFPAPAITLSDGSPARHSPVIDCINCDCVFLEYICISFVTLSCDS